MKNNGNKKMSQDDILELDRILTTYSNEEFAIIIASLCHGRENAEIKRIIEFLQNEVEKIEINE